MKIDFSLNRRPLSLDVEPGRFLLQVLELGINLEESVLGYSHILVGPSNLSPEVKKAWEDALIKIFSDPDWAAQMNKAGYPPSGLAGEYLATGVTATLTATEKFKDIISNLGIK